MVPDGQADGGAVGGLPLRATFGVRKYAVAPPTRPVSAVRADSSPVMASQMMAHTANVASADAVISVNVIVSTWLLSPFTRWESRKCPFPFSFHLFSNGIRLWWWW
jgi:hypothetical protein